MRTKKNKSAGKLSLPESYLAVLKSVGQFMEYWGFKEVHGQVWACIFLAEAPVDANHIIQHLQLSKAAISLALKDLLYYKVIIELEKTEPSTRKYKSNPDLTEVICHVLRSREKHMLAAVVNASKSLLNLPKEEYQRVHLSKEKVQGLKEMTEGAQQVLEQMLRQQNVDLLSLFGLINGEEKA